jgi:hypothetical protein
LTHCPESKSRICHRSLHLRTRREGQHLTKVDASPESVKIINRSFPDWPNITIAIDHHRRYFKERSR